MMQVALTSGVFLNSTCGILETPIHLQNITYEICIYKTLYIWFYFILKFYVFK